VSGVEFATAGEDFGDDAFSAQFGGDFAQLEVVLGEEKAEHFSGRSLRKAVVFLFVQFDEQGQQFDGLDLRLSWRCEGVNSKRARV